MDELGTSAYLQFRERNGTKSLFEVMLQVGFNKSPKIVVSHTVQEHKIIGNLKIRNATCFAKMNLIFTSKFVILFSLDTALHCIGAVPPAPGFDATADNLLEIRLETCYQRQNCATDNLSGP